MQCIHMNTYYLSEGACVIKADLRSFGPKKGVISSIRREAVLGCEASPASLSQITNAGVDQLSW